MDNMQKYANYREQMGRLKKALGHQFYLEAIFIEYAILEDRLESALLHSGKWTPAPDRHTSIDRKVRLLRKQAEEKKSLARRYFTPELAESILAWKERRNRLIHALMKQQLHTEDLQSVAEEGQTLIRMVSNKVGLFNRAIERQKGTEKQ